MVKAKKAGVEDKMTKHILAWDGGGSAIREAIVGSAPCN